MNILTSLLAAAAISMAEVLAPWQGQGQVYISEPGVAKFMGTIEGVMYVQTGHKEQIDALPY